MEQSQEQYERVLVPLHFVVIMKFICLLSFLCSLAMQAVAQVGVETQAVAQVAADRAAQREQRLVELRTVLKQQRETQMQGDQRKQFSEQERQVLRQQVRQQQVAGKSRP